MFRAFIRLLLIPNKLAMFSLVRWMAAQVQLMTLSSLHRAGVLQHLSRPRTLEELAEDAQVTEVTLLRHLLDLGVKRRLLRFRDGRYAARSALARSLAKDPAGPVASMLQEATTYHLEVFDGLPRRMEGEGPQPYLERYGEIVAQSSRIMAPWIEDFTARNFGAEGGLRILELGCGSGEYLRGYAELHKGHHGIGIDYDAKVVTAAQTLLTESRIEDRFSVLQADMRDGDTWPEGPFDRVTAHQSVYYFDAEERQGLWKRCREHLTEDGSLIIVTPTSGGPMSDYFSLILLSTTGCHRLPSLETLEEELQAAGFRSLRRERLIPGDSVWGITARAEP